MYDHYDRELGAAKQAKRMIDLPNWTLAGGLFFFFTVATTIGYGAFAPLTDGGKMITVFFGWIAIVIVTQSIDFYSVALDGRITRLAGLCCDSSEKRRSSKLRLLGVKVFVMSNFLVLYTAILAWFASHWCHSVAPDSTPQGMDMDSIYYAYQTLSTVGFGDLYCGDSKISHVVGQVVVIMPGLVVFGVFSNSVLESWREMRTCLLKKPRKAEFSTWA